MQFIGLHYETDLIVLSADYKPKQTASEVTVLKTELSEKYDECKREQVSFKRDFENDMAELKTMVE